MQSQDTFSQMWNFSPMSDFELKGEDPLNMCEAVKLCQEEYSYYNDVLPIVVSFQMMHHHMLRDQLTNYIRKWIQMMIMFLLGVIIVTLNDESTHIKRSYSNQI